MSKPRQASLVSACSSRGFFYYESLARRESGAQNCLALAIRLES